MATFHLFLPQMRMSMDTLVDRALAAESAGFEGLALMDHLAPPMAEDKAMFEAVTTAGWLLARTTTLRVSHLVLCDPLREPSVLARQAVTLDHASQGRFDLGIGWGSVPAELDTFGVGTSAAPPRVARLRESLEVITALWSGEPVSYDGAFHRIDGGVQQPPPLSRIPIVIGGAGPKTMRLVAEFADWWNCPIYAIDRFSELRDAAGAARPSLQKMVAFISEESRRSEVEALVAKRFSRMSGLVVGTSAELVDHFGALGEAGVERFYPWFTDFAVPETLEQFGEEVIAHL